MQKKAMDELSRLSVEEFRTSVKFPIVAVLDNVRSMHNVGSVFRTADAFRLQGIRLCGYTPQPPHRDIQKTALGATETVSWSHSASAIEVVDGLRAEGFEVWAVEQAQGSVALQEWRPAATSPVALVFGNEVEGVQQELLAHCTGCIEIPQLGMKHSLNVSVAAGIVLWELVRTRIAN
jgi:tRNA G18 (ribose-2'-O)-methylase SpoU